MEKYQVIDVSDFDLDIIMAICGESDRNLELIGNKLGCKVYLEDDFIKTSRQETVARISTAVISSFKLNSSSTPEMAMG